MILFCKWTVLLRENVTLQHMPNTHYDIRYAAMNIKDKERDGRPMHRSLYRFIVLILIIHVL